jgi:hypothetical protein
LLVLGAILGLALPFVANRSGLSGDHLATVCLLVALAALAGFPVVVEFLRKGYVAWFAPLNVFVGLFGMFWLLRSIYLFSSGLDLRVGGVIGHEDFLRGLAWATVGLIALYVGYYLVPGMPKTISRAATRWIDGKCMWDRRRMLGLLVGFTALCLTSYAFYMHQKGGVLHFVRHWSSKRYVPGSGAAYLKHIGYMLQPTAWFLYIYCHTSERKRGRRLLCKTLFVAYGFLASVLLLSFGGRGAVIILWVGIAVLRHYTVKPIRSRSLFTWFLLIVLSAIAVRTARSGLSARQMEPLSTGVGWVNRALASLTKDFSPVDMSYYYFAHVPEAFGFLRGSSVTGAFLYVIPRVIWRSKPVFFGPTVALAALRPALAESNTHVAPSIVGDLYLNFSYPGVVVGMLFIGVLLRASHYYLRRRGTNLHARILVYNITIVGAYWLVKAGMFAAIVRPTTSYLLPILIFTKLSTRRAGRLRKRAR